MKFISIYLICLVTQVNAFYPDIEDMFPMPVFDEPEENNCKIFESEDMRLWIRVDDHLYEVKYIVHSYACNCMSLD